MFACKRTVSPSMVRARCLRAAAGGGGCRAESRKAAAGFGVGANDDRARVRIDDQRIAGGDFARRVGDSGNARHAMLRAKIAA